MGFFTPRKQYANKQLAMQKFIDIVKHDYPDATAKGNRVCLGPYGPVVNVSAYTHLKRAMVDVTDSEAPRQYTELDMHHQVLVRELDNRLVFYWVTDLEGYDRAIAKQFYSGKYVRSLDWKTVDGCADVKIILDTTTGETKEFAATNRR